MARVQTLLPKSDVVFHNLNPKRLKFNSAIRLDPLLHDTKKKLVIDLGPMLPKSCSVVNASVGQG